MANQDNYIGIKAAWIEDLNSIRIITDTYTRKHFNEIKIFDNKELSLSAVPELHENNQLIFKFSHSLNTLKNYQVTFRNKTVWALPSLKFLNEQFSTNEPLGSTLEGTSLSVSLWSPTATDVNLLLYDHDAKTLLGKRPLIKNAKGVWKNIFKLEDFKVKSYDGLFYQYEVTAFNKINLALDPYAQSMSAFDPHSSDKIGKAAIVNIPLTKVTKSSHLTLANTTDFIGYEAHIRDFSIDPSLNIDDSLKGSFLGFTNTIPYLKNLGITHVQFMPLQKSFTVNENQHIFQGLEIPTSRLNYNWGYDPHNYFTPSGWYSKDANDPYLRISEVKKLFSELHKNGIGVILDVVYNHLYRKDILENVAPGCYLRTNELGDISEATGAGVTLESRNLMSRRLIIDSLKMWQNYYGADGFRFDLMGFIDQQTMKEIRLALGEKAILYGEAWNFTDLPFSEATTKTNFPHEASISVFNDSSRDSYAGRMENKGFVQGDFTELSRVKTGIIGAIKYFPDPHNEILKGDYHLFANEPDETLNYLSIHDGFTLWDKINLSNGGSREERERLVRFSYGLLFTSQGKIIIHGGDEFGRTKPLSPNDPHPERAHTSDVIFPENGNRFFHENTYSSSDNTNMIDWNRGEEYSELSKYVKGLIELRRSTPALHYQLASSIKQGLHFLDINALLKSNNSSNNIQKVIVYLIDNTLEDSVAKGFNKSNYKNILVIHNSDSIELTLSISNIKSINKWNILVDDQSAGIKPILHSRVKIHKGEIKVPPKCTVVLGGME